MALRIVLYSQDGLGLGHLRRTSALAARLVAIYPTARVLMLADSPRAGWFPLPSRTVLVTLPPLVRRGPDDWRPVDGLPLADVVSRRQAVLGEALAAFAPHLVVVDHLPVGAMGELLPSLLTARTAGARLALGLRDILDAPAVVRAQWERDGSLEAVECWYDQVLVYGQQDVFDVGVAYGFPPSVEAKVRYCGYLAAPAGPSVTRTHWTTAGLHLVAVVGGGADAHGVLDALVDAVPLIPHPNLHVTAVTGPFMAPVLRHQLERRSAGLPVRVLESVPDVPALLSTADVVVARAGYNTTVEACRSGVPTVLVPRLGPSQEQRLRAAAFARRGWVETVDPHGLDGPAVAAAVVAALVGERRSPCPLDFDGLERAVTHLALPAPATT